MANKLEEMDQFVKVGWDFVYLGDSKKPNVSIINSVFPDMIKLRIPNDCEGIDVEIFNIDLLNALKKRVKEGEKKFILFDNFRPTSEVSKVAEIMCERTFDNIPISDNVVFGVYGSAEEFGYKDEVIGGKQFFAKLVSQMNQKNMMDRDR